MAGAPNVTGAPKVAAPNRPGGAPPNVVPVPMEGAGGVVGYPGTLAGVPGGPPPPTTGVGSGGGAVAAGNAVTLPANGLAPVLRAPKGVGAPPPPNPVNGRDPGLGREPQGCRVTGGGGGRTKVGAGKEGITKCCGHAGVQKQHTRTHGAQ